MTDENPTNRGATAPSRVLKVGALIAILLNLGILLYFAAVATMWDDEVFSLYYSSLPLSNLLDLMSHNFDADAPAFVDLRSHNFNEDAPAFNVLQHGWQQIAHHHPLLLRLMPFTFWIASVAGVGFLANRLAGRHAMYWALIVTSLWPYHWIYPIAMRWYSLAAALGVWNLYFFVRLMESQRRNSNTKLYSPLLFGALVALTGAALWYTVLFAPAIAAGELAVAVIVARLSPRAVGTWALAWIGAIILYLPWLPTFLSELGETTGSRFSFKAIASSAYVFVAGDFSIPTAFWISLPFLAAFIVGLWLASKYWSVSRTPLLVGGIVFALVLLFGVIESKRLLLMTVLISAGIGISVAAAMNDRNRGIIRNAILAAGILVLVGFGGSIANITSKSGWFTYRWLDQVKETAQRVDLELPGALILSNSNALAFYINDPTGFELARYRVANNLAFVSETKVWNTLLRTDPDYGHLMESAISSRTDVIYVHHAFFNGSGSTEQLESVLNWLEGLGLERVGQWQSTPIQGGVERFLRLQDYPSSRITSVHLRHPQGPVR